MTRRALVCTALVVAPLLLVACDRQPGRANTELSGSIPASGDEALEQTVRADLVQVDADGRTLTALVNGVDTTFSFTDDTEVTGATDRVQGLAGRKGTSVVVTFRAGVNGREALRIHVE